MGIEQERLNHFYQLRLAQAVEQQKEQKRDNLWFLEKCAEGFEKIREEIFKSRTGVSQFGAGETPARL